MVHVRQQSIQVSAKSLILVDPHDKQAISPEGISSQMASQSWHMNFLTEFIVVIVEFLGDFSIINVGELVHNSCSQNA